MMRSDNAQAPRCRLYLISPPRIDDLDHFAGDLAAALAAGDVACFQLRLKSAEGPSPDAAILEAAARIKPILSAADVALLVNDRPDLAREAGADGVHIGQQDAAYAEARAVLGPDASIGVTCHNSRHLALEAADAGADYVAFGAFHPTKTKDAPTRADPDILEWWAYATTVPCVAIGGITPQNCAPIARAGADFVAAASAVWDHEDGAAAAVAAFNRALAAAQGDEGDPA